MTDEDPAVGIFYEHNRPECGHGFGNVSICIPTATVVAFAPIPGETEETD